MTRIGLRHTALLIATLLLTSCSKWVFDDLATCPRGVYLHLYSQTDCQSSPTYPEEVREVTLFLFDEQGRLAALQQESGLSLGEGKEVLVPLTADGAYRAVAWAGVDPQLFTTEAFTIGTTTIDDLYTTLREEADLRGHTVWQGATERDILLTPLREGETEQYVHASINLREQTNRITIIVDGLEHTDDVALSVTGGNVDYLHSGALREQGTLHSYPYEEERVESSYDPSMTRPNEAPGHNGKYTATLTTLRLESGRSTQLTLTGKESGKVLYRNDLYGLIHVANEKSKGEVNVRCQNDFVIYLKVKRCPTCSDGYSLAEIRVNNWGIHSIDVELGV